MATGTFQHYCKGWDREGGRYTPASTSPTLFEEECEFVNIDY